MYQVGDYVVYGSHGVCRIVAEEDRRIERKLIAYFSLEPMGQPGAVYYVPSKNPAALAKLRPLIEREALNELLTSDGVRTSYWIQDENRRKLRYREILSSGDCTALFSMVYTLHLHKRELLDSGRKVHQCDENFLQDATKLLTTEFSIVLNMPPADLAGYFQSVNYK